MPEECGRRACQRNAGDERAGGMRETSVPEECGRQRRETKAGDVGGRRRRETFKNGDQ